MNDNSKILISAMAAAGAGAIIGLLFAPEKGSDLRKKMITEIEEIGENFDNLVNTVKSRVREFENNSRKLKADIQQASDDTKSIFS